MPSYHERLHQLFPACLFDDDEPTDGAIIVEGCVNRYGFDPKRLEQHREQILALAREVVPDAFLAKGGGGSSLMALPFDRAGEQWGEQRDGDMLACLCMALKVAHYCLPRELWSALPGGMPYVAFDLEQPAG